MAAIDFNEQAIEVFRANFPEVPHVLRDDLTDYTPSQLAARLGTDRIDVIVGGPPRQGFSTVRQVDAANHGTRVRRDKRRYLFRAFLDYVEHFQPRVFVMENVLGLQSAAKGKFFTMVQHEARNLGYRVHPQVEESWKLGVPQKRRRQLIIGVRPAVAGFLSELEPASRAFAPSDKARKRPQTRRIEVVEMRMTQHDHIRRHEVPRPHLRQVRPDLRARRQSAPTTPADRHRIPARLTTRPSKIPTASRNSPRRFPRPLS